MPSASDARDIKFRRDLDGDGHFNTKKIDTGRHHDHHRGYSRGYGHSRNYYGRGYGGYGGYYGGSSYYSRPYYGYGYGPSLSYTYYSRPSYSYARESYSDGLAADVQRALKRRGYYGGPVDGDIGSGSRRAIRNYQADRGLSVTGRIDRSLLRALGLS